jgi:leucine zipper transcription factor-like protein 1
MQIVELENKLIMVEEERSQAIEAQISLRNEVQAMKEELKKKVNQLTQVTNMKKMITEKNEQMKKLRERLSKYEKDEDD